MTVLDSRPGAVLSFLSSRAFWIVGVVVLLLLPFAGALARELPEPPPVIAELPEFRLVNERGEPYGTAELKGRVWVASFVFTSCPSVCPKLMGQLGKVQHRSRNAGAAVHIVTFSVDPETDTPERLKEYGKRFKASPYRWTLLTGKLGAIEETVVRGFKLAMGKDAETSYQIFHSERLVLIDGEGRIRGYYEAEDAGIDRLMRDIGLVLNLG